MLTYMLALMMFYEHASVTPVAVDPGEINVSSFLEADNRGSKNLVAACDSFGSGCKN